MLPVTLYFVPVATPVCVFELYIKPVIPLGTVTFPAVTVTVLVALTVLSFPDVAVIVVVPTFLAVTTPVDETVATFVFEDVHVIVPAFTPVDLIVVVFSFSTFTFVGVTLNVTNLTITCVIPVERFPALSIDFA